MADLWTLSDLCTPWCVHVVATLRVADHIRDGTTQVDELAAATGSDRDALHNVLRHLAGKGVFMEPEPGRFALNEAAEPLLGEGARFLDLDGIGGRMAQTWSTLPQYVRTGAPAYHEVFGMSFWEDLAAHPEVGESFDELMGPAGHGAPDPELPLSGGWDGVRTVVDVGGGTGAMLAGILRARPRIRGILVDFPGTVARSGPTFEAAGVADRVTTAPQSFFDPLPAGADLYVVRKVVNDWPDAEAVALLRRCAEAARPEGRVVVVGSVSRDESLSGLQIEMLLVGGRHRTVSQFRDLAREAGLEVVGVGEQPAGYLVVECRPAD